MLPPVADACKFPTGDGVTLTIADILAASQATPLSVLIVNRR